MDKNKSSKINCSKYQSGNRLSYGYLMIRETYYTCPRRARFRPTLDRALDSHEYYSQNGKNERDERCVCVCVYVNEAVCIRHERARAHTHALQ